MVNLLRSVPWLLALAAEGSGKLPPPTRAAAMMALLGILLLGMLLVVVILVGGHWVRSWGAHRRGPVVPPDRVFNPPPKDNNPPKNHQPPSEGLSQSDTVLPEETKF